MGEVGQRGWWVQTCWGAISPKHREQANLRLPPPPQSKKKETEGKSEGVPDSLSSLHFISLLLGLGNCSVPVPVHVLFFFFSFLSKTLHYVYGIKSNPLKALVCDVVKKTKHLLCKMLFEMSII